MVSDITFVCVVIGHQKIMRYFEIDTKTEGRQVYYSFYSVVCFSFSKTGSSHDEEPPHIDNNDF